MRTILGALLMVFASFMLLPHTANASEFDLTFERGKSYGIVSNSVIRGERDNVYFGARSGQIVSIAVSSLEDNAVVELYFKRGGAWMLAEAPPDSRVLYGNLPDSDGGQYRITVAGTRGNASYDLFVGIAVVGG
jgi:hypothetical protein